MRAGQNALGEKLEMGDKAIVTERAFIKVNLEGIVDDGADLLHDAGDLIGTAYTLGIIFHLGIDKVQRNKCRLIIVEVDTGLLLDDLNRFAADLEFIGIEPTDVPLEGIGKPSCSRVIEPEIWSGRVT